MKKIIIRVLALLLILAMLLPMFFGCGKVEQTPTEATEASDIRTVYMGANGEIPCLELNELTYAAADKVEWSFMERGTDEDGLKYGVAEEIVAEPQAPMFNWYYGDNVYLNKYANPNPYAYDKLVAAMQEAGYELYYQNSINGDCRHAILKYQGNIYTVTYFVMANCLYITASGERALSPNLFPENASTQAEAVDGIGTTLTMRPTYNGGDNYIIQLKNGHFILFDGGSIYTFKDTLAYLESLVPAGEVPVVDAWFITHCHYDHVGWSAAFGNDEYYLVGQMELGEAAERIRVNGIYYNRPDSYINEHTCYNWRSKEPTTAATNCRTKNPNVWYDIVTEGIKNMRTEDGTPTPTYRPQAGQLYYFKDLTVEIPYTQEQITFAEYQMDINASSTWHLVRAEGRTFLDAGDTENVNQGHVKAMYSADYEIIGGNVDIMSAFHNGHNIYNDYINTFWAPKVFYTTKEMYSWAAQYNEANKTMLESRDIDYYCYGDGAYQYSFATGEVTKIG